MHLHNRILHNMHKVVKLTDDIACKCRGKHSLRPSKFSSSTPEPLSETSKSSLPNSFNLTSAKRKKIFSKQQKKKRKGILHILYA